MKTTTTFGALGDGDHFRLPGSLVIRVKRCPIGRDGFTYPVSELLRDAESRRFHDDATPVEIVRAATTFGELEVGQRFTPARYPEGVTWCKRSWRTASSPHHDRMATFRAEDRVILVVGCRLCGGTGLVDVLARDGYGPPAFHLRLCVCRFQAGAPKRASFVIAVDGAEVTEAVLADRKEVAP